MLQVLCRPPDHGLCWAICTLGESPTSVDHHFQPQLLFRPSLFQRKSYRTPRILISKPRVIRHVRRNGTGRREARREEGVEAGRAPEIFGHDHHRDLHAEGPRWQQPACDYEGDIVCLAPCKLW